MLIIFVCNLFKYIFSCNAVFVSKQLHVDNHMLNGRCEGDLDLLHSHGAMGWARTTWTHNSYSTQGHKHKEVFTCGMH